MDPKTFVDQLAHLAPAMVELARIGLSESEANDFHNSFLCRERQAEHGETNEILALLKGWDLRNVQIGMVRFLDLPIAMPGKVWIGYVEADPLVILDDTGDILVEELHTPGHVLWTAARNGSTLLDALIPAAEFLTKRTLGEIDFEDTGLARATAERCASLAGGERFLLFFSMLVGAE